MGWEGCGCVVISMVRLALGGTQSELIGVRFSLAMLLMKEHFNIMPWSAEFKHGWYGRTSLNSE